MDQSTINPEFRAWLGWKLGAGKWTFRQSTQWSLVLSSADACFKGAPPGNASNFGSIWKHFDAFECLGLWFLAHQAVIVGGTSFNQTLELNFLDLWLDFLNSQVLAFVGTPCYKEFAQLSWVAGLYQSWDPGKAAVEHAACLKEEPVTKEHKQLHSLDAGTKSIKFQVYSLRDKANSSFA